eukprot:12826665-Ditylum_brightwellii.AAC.1
MIKKEIFVLLDETSGGITDAIRKKMCNHRKAKSSTTTTNITTTTTNTTEADRDAEDANEAEEEATTTTATTTRQRRAAAVKVATNILAELAGSQQIENEDDNLNFMPGLDECDSAATEEADDSNFDNNEEVEEDMEEEEEYVVDEDPNHLSYNWWVPGAGPVKTPKRYRFSKDDAIEHFKLLLDGDYTAWNIFH